MINILLIVLLILVVIGIVINVKDYNSLNNQIEHIQFRIDSIEKRINELYNKLNSIDAGIFDINNCNKANYNIINAINNKLINKSKIRHPK